MFQICVLNQKVQGKKHALHSWNFFLNAMIKNIKIHIIFSIIKISK